jgi:CRP-like cAMP-binding protein
VSKGEFFGIAPFLDAERYTTSALCTKTSKVLFIEARPLIELLSNHPLIGLKMMSVVARAYFDRYQSLIDRVQRALSDLAVEK